MNTLLLVIVLIFVALVFYYLGHHGSIDQYLDQLPAWRSIND